jgi:hypothetical protein
VGDSAETAYYSDMYVTSKMASRWKEIHWWQIDKRCWEATYGPNSQQGPAHLREAKDGDGEPWPEWTGEQPYNHPDNEAQETARKELERDPITPDYAEIVGATVDHLMSIAAEAVMAHLSTFVFLSHARHRRQKTERYSAGGQSGTQARPSGEWCPEASSRGDAKHRGDARAAERARIPGGGGKSDPPGRLRLALVF